MIGNENPVFIAFRIERYSGMLRDSLAGPGGFSAVAGR
jgi:hypothetical protein